MTLAKRKRGARGLSRARSLVDSLIELPDLGPRIQALPPPTFASLVRKVGLEDAGELLALSTTEQLVQAFDEDLFVNERAGERESLDVSRFVVWLEVLLEAGDAIAADRVAEWDEDFVAHALGGVLLVIEEDALRERLEEGDEDEGQQVDKSLESALMEDLDGYLLVAKQQDGWDAVLALVLALDQRHRPLLVRLLDRLARVGSRYLDDLEELSTVLSEGESLAEDVEAAREERRSQQGYVEPRAARAFLTLARKPHGEVESWPERDALTRAYFRDVERGRPTAPMPAAQVSASSLPPAILRELSEVGSSGARHLLRGSSGDVVVLARFTEALRELRRDAPALGDARMEELAYLANVLVAGHDRDRDGDGARLRPKEAAEAVLATVCFGATLEVREGRTRAKRKQTPTTRELADILRHRSADVLFRVASSALVGGATPGGRAAGLLYSAEELEAAIGGDGR